MAEYVELYKKYRPKRWDEVIGQDKTIQSLQEVAKSEKVPTGFLFAGGPGSGKTTSAFILAKALNCEHKDENGNPCNECDTCKAIDNNAQLGVHYLSLANKGSVDDVREIMNEANLSQPIKKQVWILDEVQNLSPQAFDSTLIGLEDTNMQSLFIFCTTEPEKIRPAVLSRLQVRNFTPVDWRTIGNYLFKISKLENMEVTKEQIESASRGANGSVRTALQNLESIALTGSLPTSYTDTLVDLIVRADIQNLFTTTNEMAENGQNFTSALEDLYKTFSMAFISMAGNKAVCTKGVDNITTNITDGKLVVTMMNLIGQGLSQMIYKTVDSKILFEVTLTNLIMLSEKYVRR